MLFVVLSLLQNLVPLDQHVQQQDVIQQQDVFLNQLPANLPVVHLMLATQHPTNVKSLFLIVMMVMLALMTASVQLLAVFTLLIVFLQICAQLQPANLADAVP